MAPKSSTASRIAPGKTKATLGSNPVTSASPTPEGSTPNGNNGSPSILADSGTAAKPKIVNKLKQSDISTNGSTNPDDDLRNLTCKRTTSTTLVPYKMLFEEDLL